MTFSIIRLVNKDFDARDFVIRGDLPGANMGRHLINFMAKKNLQIQQIWQFEADDVQQALSWLNTWTFVARKEMVRL